MKHSYEELGQSLFNLLKNVAKGFSGENVIRLQEISVQCQTLSKL